MTWKYRGTPTQHAPRTNRMNAAAGLGRSGELIVLSGGWMNVVPKRQNPLSRRIEASISISNDGGRSWTRGGEMPPIPAPGLSHHTPFGDILTAKNGDLVVGTYVHEMPVPVNDPKPRSEWVGHVYALRSKDGGRTWKHVTPIVRGVHVEAAMLHAGEGKWLAASRRFGPLDLEIHASNDDGFLRRPLHFRRRGGVPAASYWRAI